MTDLHPHLERAKKLAKEAGEKILEVYNTDFEVQYKEDKSALTDADLKANDVITKGLHEAFPEIAILAEESIDDKSRLENEWCFIVDPLDGTKEFVKKNGEFTVNIALAHKGESLMGVIYVPVTGGLYFALRGGGAFYEEDGETKPIRVSDATSNLKMAASRSHLSDRMKAFVEKNNIAELVQVGSSLKGCYIAEGRADIYYRFGYTMEWDTAAMQCIVEEAGGIFRQMDDSPMRYNRVNSLNEKGFYILNNEANKLPLEN